MGAPAAPGPVPSLTVQLLVGGELVVGADAENVHQHLRDCGERGGGGGGGGGEGRGGEGVGEGGGGGNGTVKLAEEDITKI